MNKKPISPIGDDRDELKKEIFTLEEIAAGDLRFVMISKLIKDRQKNGQRKKSETASGVKQPVIVRTEKGTTDP